MPASRASAPPCLGACPKSPLSRRPFFTPVCAKPVCRRREHPVSAGTGACPRIASGARSCERHLPVQVGGDRVAMLAEIRVTAAIAHDLAGLLALDVAIDAGHP